MTDVDKHKIEASGNSMQMLVAMVGLGVLCALLIVLTFQGTMPAIKKNKAEALEKAIYKVLPGISSKTTLAFSSDSGFSLPDQELEDQLLLFPGYDEEDKLVGIAIEAVGMGFADQIKLLYGYDPYAEKVIGFYVLESKETPGLGDKIEKDSKFLANFDALDVGLDEAGEQIKNLVSTVKNGKKVNAWEIDGITGATISSRAIGDIMATSTAKWMPLIQNSMQTFENKIDSDKID